MKKEMTIHAALSYLKTADKRREKILNTSTFVSYAKQNAEKVDGVSRDEAKKAMSDAYKSVTDINRNVEAIKRAISEANASLKITVCGEEMSVAEAIYMMNYGVDAKRRILETLRSQYTGAKRAVDRANGIDLDERADQFIIALYGSKDKANGQDALAVREKFKKENSFEIVDSIGVLSEIKAREDWIDRFESEVDGAIQVSNATHTITIDV